MVELPGIEPGSSAASAGLLRAQSAVVSTRISPSCGHVGDDDPSHCELSRSAPWPGGPVIPLDDAGDRVEEIPGPTDYELAIRQRGRSRADWYRRVIGCHDAYGGLWPAPARFPCVSSRSRNHISPSQVPPAWAERTIKHNTASGQNIPDNPCPPGRSGRSGTQTESSRRSI